MGSDESHFNVSIIVRDKVTRQCPETTTFEEKGEPKRIRTDVPLLTSLTNALQLGWPTGSQRESASARDEPFKSSIFTMPQDDLYWHSS